jgi:hypothetical protein
MKLEEIIYPSYGSINLTWWGAISGFSFVAIEVAAITPPLTL